MKYSMTRILVVLLLTIGSIGSAIAGIGDPWYLAYRVKGGTITKYMGPYSSKYSCEAARFSLPIGSIYIGCFQ